MTQNTCNSASRTLKMHILRLSLQGVFPSTVLPPSAPAAFLSFSLFRTVDCINALRELKEIQYQLSSNRERPGQYHFVRSLRSPSPNLFSPVRYCKTKVHLLALTADGQLLSANGQLSCWGKVSHAHRYVKTARRTRKLKLDCWMAQVASL